MIPLSGHFHRPAVFLFAALPLALMASGCAMTGPGASSVETELSSHTLTHAGLERTYYISIKPAKLGGYTQLTLCTGAVSGNVAILLFARCYAKSPSDPI